MYVILVKEGSPCVYVEAKLSRGYQPVSGHSEQVKIDQHIEPGRWFKAMVIDDLVIDCNKRTVRWSVDSTGPDFDGASVIAVRSYVLFSEGEFYDYDAKCDELFDTVSEMLDNYKSGEITEKELNKTLLRMLHCHVLPNIKLCQDSIPKLQKALHKQEEEIALLDEQITGINSFLYKQEQDVNNFRDRFVQQLKTSPDQVHSFSLNMLVLLNKHVCKDVEQASQVLNNYECAVAEAKQGLKKKPNKDVCKWELETRRQARDEYYKEYESQLHVREIIANRLFSLQKYPSGNNGSMLATKSHVPVLHKSYLETNKRISEYKEQIQQLLEIKLLMLSVKEAMRFTLNDLSENLESMGVEVQRGTAYQSAVDVLCKPHVTEEWLTLEEKISNLACKTDSTIGRKHTSFCKTVASICQESKNEEEFYRALQTQGSHTLEFDGKVPSGTTRWFVDEVPSIAGISVADYLLVCDLKENPAAKAAKRLKVVIQNHFTEMSRMMQKQLQGSIHMLNKMWIAYESIFYENMMPILCDVYESAYKDSIVTLKNQTSGLSVSDLQVEEPWLLDLLQVDPNNAEKVTPKVEETIPKQLDCTTGFEQLHLTFRPRNRSGQITTEADSFYCSLASTSCCSQLTAELNNSNTDLEDSTQLSDIHTTEYQIKSAKFTQIFLSALKCLNNMISEVTPLGKMQQLTHCLKAIATSLGGLQESGRESTTCSDDLVTIIILLLLNCDETQIGRIYTQVALVTDLMAPFLESGVHSYSLVQFHVAFQFIFTKLMEKRNSLTSSTSSTTSEIDAYSSA